MADAEERFRLLFNMAPVPLQSSDERQRVVEVNDRWLELLGYEHHEVSDQPVTSFMTDQSAHRYHEMVAPALLRGEAVRDLELRFLTKQGEERKVVFSAGVQAGEHDGTYQAIAALHNLHTWRKKEEIERVGARRRKILGGDFLLQQLLNLTVLH